MVIYLYGTFPPYWNTRSASHWFDIDALLTQHQKQLGGDSVPCSRTLQGQGIKPKISRLGKRPLNHNTPMRRMRIIVSCPFLSKQFLLKKTNMYLLETGWRQTSTNCHALSSSTTTIMWLWNLQSLSGVWMVHQNTLTLPRYVEFIPNLGICSFSTALMLNGGSSCKQWFTAKLII